MSRVMKPVANLELFPWIRVNYQGEEWRGRWQEVQEGMIPVKEPWQGTAEVYNLDTKEGIEASSELELHEFIADHSASPDYFALGDQLHRTLKRLSAPRCLECCLRQERMNRLIRRRRKKRS